MSCGPNQRMQLTTFARDDARLGPGRYDANVPCRGRVATDPFFVRGTTMRFTKYFVAMLLLLFGLAQFLQFGMILGLKMANAGSGIAIDVSGRLAINGSLFLVASLGACLMWRWAAASRRCP